MDKIIRKLTNMEAWIEFNSPPAESKTNAELMRFVVEVMNRCLYLLRVGVAAAPDAETANTGYAKPQAIIVGYMVQLTKLYEGALIQICGGQPELTRLFSAPILEVARNMEALIMSSEQFDYSSISDSYPSEQKMFRELEGKVKKHLLTPEGPDCIHREWHDIRSYYLTQKGDSYAPDLSPGKPDPRLGCQLTQICLETLFVYLKWNRSDPDALITSVAVKLCELNVALDEGHENTLGE
ncbi:hypothetical protein F4Y59_09010 [Candidatus Poribacteria bacterium]|nr:hypothetical protein [Candidatus Poribacteria bacterium]MYK19808.1 hypothetical protein [Candidatus Poribacteria bacterium]